MGYKILGFMVWKGAKWFARRKVNATLGGRRVATAALVAVAVTALAVAAARRESS